MRDAPEIARGADVDHEHDGQLAFFGEFFYESMSEPRGDVPIDRADFVAGLVFAYIFEIHPSPLEDAVVIAGKSRLHEPLGFDLEGADLLQDLRWGLVRGGHFCDKKPVEREPIPREGSAAAGP